MSKVYPGIRRVGPNKYRIRVTATCPRTGRRKELDRVVDCGSAQEALKAQVMMREELVRSEVSERVRLKEYARRWFERKRPLLKYSTALRYAEHLDQIMAGLGDVYMDRLTPGMIADFLADKAREYSGWTCVGMLRILRTMTRDAMADLRLEYWPCERVGRPKAVAQYTDEEPNALTAEELGRLWEAMRANEPAWFPLFATMALTGLRFAEASALKWGDIDSGRGTIHVRRNLYRGVEGTPKTAGSRRRLPLLPELAEALRLQRERLLREQNPGLAAGWVFPSAAGTPLSASAMRKPLERGCKAAGIDRRLTPHGLRRTLNSIALQVAPGEVVRKITGHTTADMTAHYFAPDMAAKRSLLGKVVSLVQKADVGIPVGIPGDDAVSK